MVAKNPFGTPSEQEWDFNFEGVSDGFPTIPTGTYFSIVADVNQEPGKGEYPNLVWTFEISTGDQAGQTIKMWNTLNPLHLGFLKRTLSALGFDTEKGVRFKRADVVGKSCLLFIEKGEYQGKPNSSIKNVAPLPEDAQEKAGPKRKGMP